MPRKKKNLPVPKKSTAVNGVPSYLTQDGDLGLDGIDKADIVIPRLKMCQKPSDIHKENKSIKDGEFYDSISKTVIRSPRFFIGFHWKSTVFFSDERKFLASVFTAKSTGTEIWNGSPADIDYCKQHLDEGQDSHNYFILMEDEIKDAIRAKSPPLPTVYSTISAANKYARMLNSKLKINGQRGMPIYSQLVVVSSVEDSFKKGEAFMPRFDFDRYATQAEAGILKLFHTECAKLQATVDVTDKDGVPF